MDWRFPELPSQRGGVGYSLACLLARLPSGRRFFCSGSPQEGRAGQGRREWAWGRAGGFLVTRRLVFWACLALRSELAAVYCTIAACAVPRRLDYSTVDSAAAAAAATASAAGSVRRQAAFGRLAEAKDRRLGKLRSAFCASWLQCPQLSTRAVHLGASRRPRRERDGVEFPLCSPSSSCTVQYLPWAFEHLSRSLSSVPRYDGAVDGSLARTLHAPRAR